jgi:hypothetical protein
MNVPFIGISLETAIIIFPVGRSLIVKQPWGPGVKGGLTQYLMRMATVICNEGPRKSADIHNGRENKTKNQGLGNEILFRVYFGLNIERLSKSWQTANLDLSRD